MIESHSRQLLSHVGAKTETRRFEAVECLDDKGCLSFLGPKFGSRNHPTFLLVLHSAHLLPVRQARSTLQSTTIFVPQQYSYRVTRYHGSTIGDRGWRTGFVPVSAVSRFASEVFSKLDVKYKMSRQLRVSDERVRITIKFFKFYSHVLHFHSCSIHPKGVSSFSANLECFLNVLGNANAILVGSRPIVRLHLLEYPALLF